MHSTQLGVDTGGTFTDFFLVEGDRVRYHKEPSTPDAPHQAILSGMAVLGVLGRAIRIVHGSTVGTNAVLEGKGVRTAFVTNRGLKDLLTIGRQARPELYDLMPKRVPPPVPPELCLETGGRLGANGETIDPLMDEDLARLRETIAALSPAAVAVNLLFSFLDGRHERAIAAALPAGLFVSCSSDVLPEFREYERGIATWLNAYIGPIMQGYLAQLADAVRPARLLVMQSSGLTLEAARAGRLAVNLLLSGPAGGLQGARHCAHAIGVKRMLTFDMGGTSTDVALIEGEVMLTTEGRLGRYPVGVPMVDMHTIGAGGGSIARVDVGGLLHVGPESAGAQPGPACYGRGGGVPTVTDAHLVLGRIPEGTRLAGGVELDKAAAMRALADLGAALGGLRPEAAAAGVIAIANERMQEALRVISVMRGIDPRAHTLVSFGGAGGLHVCELADALGIEVALVPAQAGVLSALGLLAAPIGRHRSRTVRRRLEKLDTALVARLFEELATPDPGDPEDSQSLWQHTDSVDLCYEGQSFTFNVPWTTPDDVARDFHAAHEARYGHRLDLPVQLVTARVRKSAPPAAIALPRHTSRPPHAPVGASRIAGLTEPVPVWRREQLEVGEQLEGPLVVLDDIATTYVAPGWRLLLDEWGHCRLRRAR